MDYNNTTDAEILLRIGSKLKELRLNQNIKQKEIAERSGLSLFSISQMETGHNTSVQSVIQVLRALGSLNMFDSFILKAEEGSSLVTDRQRVSRSAAYSAHTKTCYSLPEDNDYVMAAEPET